MAHVIAIANQKGGVAKSVSTINIGAVLAMKGYSVLLVDMDPQANCSAGVGVYLSKDAPSIHAVIATPDQGLDSIICETSVSNLFIAPSHIDLSESEQYLYSEVGGEKVLSTAIAMTESKYDYVLIDTPPSLGMLSINAMVAANSVIIPTTAEAYALDGMKALSDLIAKIRTRLQCDVEVLGVLITNYQQITKVHSTLRENLSEYWGDRIFNTVIRKNIDVSAAALENVPVIAFNPKCNASMDYIALVEEILTREQRTNEGTR